MKRILSIALAAALFTLNFLTVKPVLAAGENSTPILVNTEYTGTVTNYGQNYYSFTLPSDGNVTLSMLRNVSSSWYVTLKDINGNTIKQFSTYYGTIASGYDERQVGLPKGTYYIMVSNYTYNNNITPYKFQVKFKAGDRYEKEQNNTLEQANLINLNKTYYGVSQDPYEDDYFVLTTPGNGNVTLSIKRNTKSSWGMTLYSLDRNVYKSFNTTYGTTVTGYDTKEVGLPKGTYIVKIENNVSAEDVPYEFQVKYTAGNYYEKEANGCFETANPIGLNAVYKGAVQGNYSDDDYYTFALTKTQQIRLSIPRNASASWYVTLYNAYKNNIISYYTAYGSMAKGNEERIITLAPGTYYLKIVNYNSNAIDIPYEFGIWNTSPKLATSQVTITNNKGKADTISVVGLGTGDVVKVYNASSGGTLLASSKATSTGQVAMTVAQIGQKAGNVYVTITKSGWTESARTAVSFKGEQSNPLTTSQVKIENNKGIPDVLTVTSLGTDDVVKAYDSNGKLIGVSMPATLGKAAIAFVQIGKTAGKVYVTVTRSGMTESTKTGISFAAELI